MARGTLRLVLVSLLLAILAEASSWQPSSSEDSDKYSQEFRTWKHSLRERNDARRWNPPNVVESPTEPTREPKVKQKQEPPPPISKVALMARYIVNQADWTSVATISSRKDTKKYPFVNLVSLSDGPRGNGTGTLYMFLTPLDYTAQDVFQDNRATLMISLAQGNYCKKKKYDPMDPRCSRVLFSGKIKALKEDNVEFPIAKNAMFKRHPWLAHMPEDHHFFLAKLKINTIVVLDTFGGPKHVSSKEYYHPNPVALADYFSRYQFQKNDFYSEIFEQPKAIHV